MSALSAAQYGVGALVTTFMHPLGYAKVLIQVGYEPIAPQPSTSLLGKRSLMYPNVFQYVGHINKTDGFWGMFRGVVPRILSGTIGNLIQNTAMEALKGPESSNPNPSTSTTPDDDELVLWMKTFLKETSQETIARCMGIVASQPFHVIMVRCMVQFVGKESAYSTTMSSIGEIYKTEGILGFFAGIVPRLVGEVITVWISNFLAQLINKYLVEDKEMRSYTSAACGLVVSHLTYPFTLVTNIMTINGTSLKAARDFNFTSWTSCFSTLRSRGVLKRGSSMFWRHYTGPVMMRDGRLFPISKLM